MSFKFDSYDAIIHLEKTQVDSETFKQISTMIKSPVVNHCRVMPDCHAGMGCCVGMTFHLTDKILPRIIGADIGCGITSYVIDNSANKFKSGKYEKKFDKLIQSLIPTGNGHDKVHEEAIIQEEQYNHFFSQATEEAKKFAEKYKEKFNVDISGSIPLYSTTWMKELCKKIGSDYNYDLRCMGTLGGGNHFIEVEESDKTNEIYLTVHTGSRNLGIKVCTYHENKIKDEYLTGTDAYEYFFDMIFAQIYAKMNRRAILSRIITNLNMEYSSSKIIESVHNFIDFGDMVVRKGAIPAHDGQKCIIALNMRDGILICKGKGNSEWNYSAAHGCGRIVSRNKAKNKFTLKQYKNSMKDVYSTCINDDTIDEIPMAYKDAKLIMETLEPTVEILVHAKPTLNIKGS
jgi:tRNA-splicing ligase RtcB